MTEEKQELRIEAVFFTPTWRMPPMKPITRDIIDRVIERLRRNEMQAHYFPASAEAKEEVLKRIPLAQSKKIDFFP